MDCSLPPLGSLNARSGPDLRLELERLRRDRRDVVIAGSDVRLAEIADEPALRLGDQLLPLAPPAAEALAALVPLSGPRALIAHRHDVDAWLITQDELTVRMQERAVVAVMPRGWRLIDDIELLGLALESVATSGVTVKVEHCRVRHGEWLVTLVAPELAAAVVPDDYIYGGLYLSSSPVRDSEACARIYRVACRNGALADLSEGRRVALPRQLRPGRVDPYATWQDHLRRIVATSFCLPTVDEDAQRMRKTIEEMLASPYEHLCHLRAQGLITADEQVLIQREFSRAGDQTLYGLINAITSIAHGHRSADEWRRAIAMERLGGEILRGDHMPPTLSPTYSR